MMLQYTKLLKQQYICYDASVHKTPETAIYMLWCFSTQNSWNSNIYVMMLQYTKLLKQQYICYDASVHKILEEIYFIIMSTMQDGRDCSSNWGCSKHAWMRKSETRKILSDLIPSTQKVISLMLSVELYLAELIVLRSLSRVGLK